MINSTFSQKNKIPFKNWYTILTRVVIKTESNTKQEVKSGFDELFILLAVLLKNQHFLPFFLRVVVCGAGSFASLLTRPCCASVLTP